MDTSKSELQLIPSDFHLKKHLNLFVKRDDLIDPEVSGNKWRKLSLNLELALHLKKEGIITFGGAYSNHLLATASACYRIGMKSVGIVRGEELNADSNPNLKRCTELGMQLVFVSRNTYDCRCESGEQEAWKERYSSFHLVPEGGANFHGTLGCQEIIREIDVQIDHLFVAQGTCTTSCGLLLGLNENSTLHAVPVLKGFQSKETMHPLLNQVLMDDSIVQEYLNQVIVHDQAHFGGYGKWNTELETFIQEIHEKIQLPLDKVYTGKAFFAMMEWIRSTEFENPTNVVFLHTGGLLNA